MEPTEVTFHRHGGDASTVDSRTFALVDTPEVREMLEGEAIPKCAEWRKANPEFPEWMKDARYRTPDKLEPAPYCCSAYCIRCAGLRALDRETPLRPNEWMEKA